MTYKHSNGRLVPRSGNGQFRKATGKDFGIGGVCEVCNHLLLQHYNGDENERPLDPRGFRSRCFACEPLTEAEQAKRDEREANKPKERSIIDMIIELAEQKENEQSCPEK